MQNKNPIGRVDNLVVQEYGKELLVYDLTNHRAMSLNETSARVWRACDGQRSLADIAGEIGDEGITMLALSELKKVKLVDANTAELAKFEGLPRREAIKRIGAGAVAAIPVIASLVAPASVQAQGSCLGANQQCSIAVGATPCCAPRTCQPQGNPSNLRCQ